MIYSLFLSVTLFNAFAIYYKRFESLASLYYTAISFSNTDLSTKNLQEMVGFELLNVAWKFEEIFRLKYLPVYSNVSFLPSLAYLSKIHISGSLDQRYQSHFICSSRFFICRNNYFIFILNFIIV